MRKSIIVVLIFLIVVGGVCVICNLSRPPTVYEFELDELSDGVYAYRETVVSSIPAENYTMATVCIASGDIITVKGTVHIINTNDGKPHAVLENTNIVNGDTITIYAPLDSVKYLGATSVGRR